MGETVNGNHALSQAVALYLKSALTETTRYSLDYRSRGSELSITEPDQNRREGEERGREGGRGEEGGRERELVPPEIAWRV